MKELKSRANNFRSRIQQEEGKIGNILDPNENLLSKPPSSPPTFQFEWHASVDSLTILSSLSYTPGNNKRVLLAGNGNSNLPQLIP